MQTRNTTQVSNATVADIEELTRLYVESVHKHFKGTLPDEELAMWRCENESKRFTKQLEDQETTIRVIRADHGELIGFTRFEVDPDNAKNGCLESVFVKDNYHRMKYGTLLFLDAQTQFRTMGFSRMILWTPTKGSAHGFYQRLGGKQCGQKVNEIHFDLTAYSWELT